MDYVTCSASLVPLQFGLIFTQLFLQLFQTLMTDCDPLNHGLFVWKKWSRSVGNSLGNSIRSSSDFLFVEVAHFKSRTGNTVLHILYRSDMPRYGGPISRPTFSYYPAPLPLTLNVPASDPLTFDINFNLLQETSKLPSFKCNITLQFSTT